MKKQNKLFTKLKISIIFLCILLFGAESAIAGDLASSWENYRSLYEKSKAMLATVEEKGSTETEAYKQALTNLISTLESNSSTNDAVSAAISNLQSEAGNIKDKPEMADLQSQLEGLNTTSQQCQQRLKGSAGLVEVAMPVGFKKTFGDFGFHVSMDSLRFIRGDKWDDVSDDTILVNALLKMTMPFVTSSTSKSHEIAFEGKDVRLAGPNAESKIYLKTSHNIPIVEDKFSIEILPKYPTNKSELGLCSEKKDEETWVSFDCNGIKDVNLVGRFVFSQSFIYAASDKTKPNGTANVDAPKTGAEEAANADAKTDKTEGQTDGGDAPKQRDGTVYAYFTIHGNQFITTACFSDSFKIRGCGDFVFKIQDAIVDLSDKQNASGFKLPTGYWDDNKEAGLEEEAWSGFYLKKMDVRFPRELDLNNSKDKSGRITVENVLIDDYGFTGSVWMIDFLDKGNHDDKGKRLAKNPGLGISIDSLGVQFWQGDFIKGLISGQANIPFLGNESENPSDSESEKKDAESKDEKKDAVVKGSDLKFRGSLGYNPTDDHYIYNVSLKIEHETKFKVPFTTKAFINITAGELAVNNNNEDSTFAASFAVDGELSLKSKLHIPGIRFEALKFSTQEPHISVGGLGLTGKGKFKFGGLTLQLSDIMWRPGEGAIVSGQKMDKTTENVLDLSARIELMPDKNSLSAEAGFTVHAVFDTTETHWEYSKLTVKKISLNADFSAFKFNGSIEHFDEDKVYGTGYRGDISLTVKPIDFKIGAQACFGNTYKKDSTDKFGYWFAKADVDFGKKSKVQLFPTVFAKSFTGGVYRRMGGPSILDSTSQEKKIKLANVADYKPDENMGFGFIAGVGAFVAKDNAVNCNVEFEINFNSNWGLNQIKLSGLVSVMTELKKDDQTTKGTVSGWLGAEYNHPKKTFAAQAGVDIEFGEVLKGSGNMDLYIGPDGWHFYLGTNEKPNNIKFIKMFNARSYFMLGKIPRRLAPMNEKVANYFKVDHSSAQGQDAAVKDAKGFAFGLDVSAGADCKSKREIFYASFSVDAGVDLMVKENDCGKAKWRVSGDTYIMANGEAGVTIGRKRAKRKKKKPKKIAIIKGSMYCMLQGTVPAPAYAQGKAGMTVRVLFIRIPNLEFSIEVGDNKCLN